MSKDKPRRYIEADSRAELGSLSHRLGDWLPPVAEPFRQPKTLRSRSTASLGLADRLTSMLTIILLIASNIFMTVAWYGQLRFPQWSIATAILVGWGIALLEYSLAVPANRIGYANGYTGGQLKIVQEVITLAVFGVFATIVLKEPIGWRYVGACACIFGAAAFMFVGRS